MRTAAKIDLTNGMVTLDDGSKKTIDNYILELEDRFIELQEVLLKQNQEIDQLKAREKEHQRLNGELREENEKLNNIINKGIEAINVYQNERTLSVGYQDLKRIREILRGNEFDLQMFEEYLQELKGEDKE